MNNQLIAAKILVPAAVPLTMFTEIVKRNRKGRLINFPAGAVFKFGNEQDRATWVKYMTDKGYAVEVL